MTEEKEVYKPPHLIDEVKDLLPEIDFSGIEAVTETREQMQARLDSMEKSIQSLTEILGETIKLYEATKNETKLLQEHHLTTMATASKATIAVGDTMMKMLSVDYEKLVMVMAQKGIIDKKKLTKTLREAIEKNAELDGFAEKVSAHIEPDIDYGDLAEEIDYSDLGSYVDFDPTDYWDSSDLAYHYSASEIADYVDLEAIAQYIEVESVANHLDMEDLINHIDLDAIVQQVKASLKEVE